MSSDIWYESLVNSAFVRSFFSDLLEHLSISFVIGVFLGSIGFLFGEYRKGV